MSHAKRDNTTSVVVELIKSLKIPVTAKTLETELNLHPEYPSLLAINDVLNQFDISTYPFADVTTEQLLSVQTPFIAHTKSKGDGFKLIKQVTATEVSLDGKSIPLEDFLKIFTGTILIVEPGVAAGDVNFKSNRWMQFLNSLRLPATLTLIALMLLGALIFHSNFFASFNFRADLLLLIKLLGLVTSILLLMQSIDSNNPLVQALCHSETNTNCNAILSSKAAQAFNGLSWSEVGFFYFAGTFLTLLFNFNSSSVIQCLAILNLLCLPYTFYSIYYQGFIAKQWCIFCCTIQGLLWVEFICLFGYLQRPLGLPSMQECTDAFICFTIPFVLWIWAKPFLVEAQKVNPLNKQLFKFKYNIDLFGKLLSTQPKYASPDPSWSLVLGNTENPSNIITIVSNPYCNPCNKAHETIEELLTSKKNLQVRFVFAFNKMEDDDIRMIVAQHLLMLDAITDKKLVREAMNEWYIKKQKKFDSWKEKYPASINNESTILKLQKNLDWLKLTEITATPTVLVNGYKLPYPYVLSDLKYF